MVKITLILLYNKPFEWINITRDNKSQAKNLFDLTNHLGLSQLEIHEKRQFIRSMFYKYEQTHIVYK